MRLYCHVCGKLQAFTATSSNSIACEKCNHQQPTNNMATKNTKGGLTGSKRFKESENEGSGSRLKHATEKVKETASNTTPTTPTIPTSSNIIGSGLNNSNSQRSRSIQNEYGGLSLPTFEPQQYLATDLFTDSSSLSRTKKEDADAMVDSIEEKKETLRVAGANLELNTEVIKTGVKSEKMVQAAIDYGTAKVNTETKLVNFDTANVQYDIAVSKFHQAGEKLVHENITLQGLRAETDQRQRYWQEKYSLGEVRIKQVHQAKFQLESKISAIDTEAERID